MTETKNGKKIYTEFELGYNKAIDDFVYQIITDKCVHEEQLKHINKIAKQLKK